MIENVLTGQIIKHSVVGIGININQEIFPAYLPNPVSLLQILHKKSSIKEVLLQLCAGIEFYYLKLKAGKSEENKQEYLDNLYGLGQELQFRANDKVFEGEIFTVNHSGLLGVKKQKETQFYDLKQIKFIFN